MQFAIASLDGHVTEMRVKLDTTVADLRKHLMLLLGVGLAYPIKLQLFCANSILTDDAHSVADLPIWLQICRLPIYKCSK